MRSRSAATVPEERITGDAPALQTIIYHTRTGGAAHTARGNLIRAEPGGETSTDPANKHTELKTNQRILISPSPTSDYPQCSWRSSVMLRSQQEMEKHKGFTDIIFSFNTHVIIRPTTSRPRTTADPFGRGGHRSGADSLPAKPTQRPLPLAASPGENSDMRS